MKSTYLFTRFYDDLVHDMDHVWSIPSWSFLYLFNNIYVLSTDRDFRLDGALSLCPSCSVLGDESIASFSLCVTDRVWVSESDTDEITVDLVAVTSQYRRCDSSSWLIRVQRMLNVGHSTASWRSFWRLIAVVSRPVKEMYESHDDHSRWNIKLAWQKRILFSILFLCATNK